MYILTYKGRPATVARVNAVRNERPITDFDYDEDMVYIAAPTRRKVVERFIYLAGFTFAEWRKDGFKVERLLNYVGSRKRPVRNAAAKVVKRAKVLAAERRQKNVFAQMGLSDSAWLSRTAHKCKTQEEFMAKCEQRRKYLARKKSK